jgi:hypothetical protein
VFGYCGNVSGELDVFISYRGTQASWALRLEKTLKMLGYSVYLDRGENGLRSRDDWRVQLAGPIEEARHFFVLWSREIPVDSIVHTEIDHRRMVAQKSVEFLLLDDVGLPEHFTLDHQFKRFLDLYASVPPESRVDGAALVNGLRWNQAVFDLVQEQMVTATKVHPVPVAVFAMTKQQAAGLAESLATSANPLHGRLSSLLDRGAAFDINSYGNTPTDWMPFYRAGYSMSERASIAELLPRLSTGQMEYYALNAYEERFGGAHFFVDYTGLIADPTTRDAALNQLASNASIVVVDAVSLLHQDVRGDLLDTGLATAPKAFLISVGPLLESELSPLGEYVKGIEADLFKELALTRAWSRSRADYHPQLSSCLLNVGNRFELLRIVQLASDNAERWMSEQSQRLNPEWNRRLPEPSQRTAPSLGGRR